jgi:hypothetical protein
MSSIYAQLRDTWIAGGIDINSGTDSSSIARFEQKRSVVLPQEWHLELKMHQGKWKLMDTD